MRQGGKQMAINKRDCWFGVDDEEENDQLDLDLSEFSKLPSPCQKSDNGQLQLSGLNNGDKKVATTD